MPSRNMNMLTVAALVTAAFATTSASAAPKSEAWGPTLTFAHDTGSAIHGAPLRSGELVQVAISLQMRNEAAIDTLTAKILAGQTRERLSSSDFMKNHAPSEASAQAVVDHLTKNGFTRIEVAPNRMIVTAQGTAGALRSAFKADLHHFNVDGRDAFANVTDAKVPSTLAGKVMAVIGLQSVDLPHTMLKEADISTDASTAATTLATTGHSPSEFPAIYNANVLPPATNSTVAIISSGNIAQSLTDLNTYVAKVGYPTPSVSTVVVGSAGTDTSGVPEWNLDSQDALSAAGGQLKKMIFYVATSLADSALTPTYNKAVSDNLAQAINVSLGECETAAKRSGIIATDDAIYKIAVAQGQTFTVSSGDSGSKECGRRKVGQSYPAVSPYVIALGGTTLTTSAPGVWSGETVWSGGGGGPSATEAAQSYQVASGVLKGATSRGVPDISFDADPSSGSIITLNGKTAQYGGTSLSAPLFAGFWARIQSANANKLIFPASALYQFGPGNPSLFHDVTSGNNGGYTAAPGWDYATGFGSVNIGNLATFITTHSGF